MDLLFLLILFMVLLIISGIVIFDNDMKKIPNYKLHRERAKKIAEQERDSKPDGKNLLDFGSGDTKYWKASEDYAAVATISVLDAAGIEKSPDVLFLDVRKELEHQKDHIDGSRWIPAEDLEQRISELEIQRDKQIVVYCRLGNKSLTIAEILVEHGFNATTLEGGFTAWKKMKIM